MRSHGMKAKPKAEYNPLHSGPKAIQIWLSGSQFVLTSLPAPTATNLHPTQWLSTIETSLR